MIRKTESPRRRGRPPCSTRLFVEDLARIEAEPGLVAQAVSWFGAPLQVALDVTWLEGITTTLTVTVVTSKQHRGGLRRWLRCPACMGRVGMLLSDSPRTPFVCRRCVGACYVTDYARRADIWRLKAALGVVVMPRRAGRRRNLFAA